MPSLAGVLALALVAGCRSTPLRDSAWQIDDGEEQRFARDKLECVKASRVPGAISTAATDSMLYEACMTGRGWQRQSP